MQTVNGVDGERAKFEGCFQTGMQFVSLGFLPALVVCERTQGLAGIVKLVSDMSIVALPMYGVEVDKAQYDSAMAALVDCKLEDLSFLTTVRWSR